MFFDSVQKCLDKQIFPMQNFLKARSFSINIFVLPRGRMDRFGYATRYNISN